VAFAFLIVDWEMLKQLVGPLAPWKVYIDAAAAVSAFVAASLWLKASLIKMPAEI
jgi:hypothetical protein